MRAEVEAYCAKELATVAQRDAVTDDGTLSNSPKVLSDMAALGWLGVSLPEEYGGGGAGVVDECIFLEESSRGLAPVTGYLTGVTAAQTYLCWANDEQKKTIASNLAAGAWRPSRCRSPARAPTSAACAPARAATAVSTSSTVRRPGSPRRTSPSTCSC